MGQDWRPDQVVCVGLERALVAYMESQIQTLEDPMELALWSLTCAYFAFCFVVAMLRTWFDWHPDQETSVDFERPLRALRGIKDSDL